MFFGRCWITGEQFDLRKRPFHEPHEPGRVLLLGEDVGGSRGAFACLVETALHGLEHRQFDQHRRVGADGRSERVAFRDAGVDRGGTPGQRFGEQPAAGEPFAGVIYSPIQDEMYAAERGSGAFLNGRRLRVSGRRRLEESLFATGIPFLGLADHALFLRQLSAVMAVASGVRRFGSAALDLAYVAAGRYDGFWENGLNPWDIAAGIVLVREAGGFVTDLSGGRKMLSGGGVLASNGALHEDLMRLVGTASASAAAAR